MKRITYFTKYKLHYFLDSFSKWDIQDYEFEKFWYDITELQKFLSEISVNNKRIFTHWIMISNLYKNNKVIWRWITKEWKKYLWNFIKWLYFLRSVDDLFKIEKVLLKILFNIIILWILVWVIANWISLNIY